MGKKFSLLTALLLALLLSGCGREEVSQTLPVVQTARLQVSVTQAEDAYADTKISGVNFCCIGVTDAAITIGGVPMELKTALLQGKTSLGEIFAMAQADARAGFCEERWKSKNSLAQFCYAYPDFDLWLINDIYETPDGKQHLIRSVTLAYSGSNVYSVHPDLDQEDWGIGFSVAKATPGSITLDYTQSGGQLIGQLEVGNYEISRLNPMEVVPYLDGTPWQERMPIPHNTQGSITLDVESYFGQLPPGEYGMYLYLYDEYEEEDVPPLVRNYHDMQCCWIEFSIV